MDNPNETGSSEQTADAPFTPEALAALGKARRSFGISIGILLLGFMAIGFALVYRVMRDAPPPVLVEAVSVPVGAEVVSALVNEGSVNVTYKSNGVTTLAVFDQETGELTQSIVIR